jgi:DNA-binding LytR/AlgR family response regulator
MFKIAICDCNQQDRESLEKIINTCKNVKGMDIKLNLYKSGTHLLFDLLKGESINLLFIELDLGEEEGKDIVFQFQDIMKIKDIKVVFMSQSVNSIMSLFELKPYHFITKPLQAAMVCELVLEINNKMYRDMEYSQFRLGKEVIRN